MNSLAMLVALVLVVVVVVCTHWIDAQTTNCGACSASSRFRRDLDSSGCENGKLEGGDMMYRCKDYARHSRKQKKKSDSRFRMGTDLDPRYDIWTNGIVNYYLTPSTDPTVDMTQYRSTISYALNQLSLAIAAQGCSVKFIDAGTSGLNSNTNYVIVQNAGGCWSYIGRVGYDDPGSQANQTLSLGAGCIFNNTIQHEFIHALGFYHEHQLPLRDNYITINWPNVRNDYCSAFSMCTDCCNSTAYNVNSVMHYPHNAFTCNGLDTMTLKSNPSIPINITYLQQTDVASIVDLYCKKTIRTWPTC